MNPETTLALIKWRDWIREQDKRAENIPTHEEHLEVLILALYRGTRYSHPQKPNAAQKEFRGLTGVSSWVGAV